MRPAGQSGSRETTFHLHTGSGEKEQEVGPSYTMSKPPLCGVLSPASSPTKGLEPSQIASPVGDQVFKTMNL